MKRNREDKVVEEIEKELDRKPSSLRVLLILLALSAVCILCLLSAYVRAATVTLSCTPPTQNTDGSTITKPITLKAYWGTSAAAMTNTAPMGSCAGSMVTVPDPAPGTSVTYHLAVTATVDAVESVRSNVVTKSFTTPKPTPNPPTSLTAAAGATAYSIKPDYTTFGPMQVAKAVGKVRTPTACIARQRIDGTDFYRVPKSAVAFSSGATDYVVAQCETKS